MAVELVVPRHITDMFTSMSNFRVLLVEMLSEAIGELATARDKLEHMHLDEYENSLEEFEEGFLNNLNYLSEYAQKTSEFVNWYAGITEENTDRLTYYLDTVDKCTLPVYMSYLRSISPLMFDYEPDFVRFMTLALPAHSIWE